MANSTGALPAVVTAGDGRAAKAVYGESKVFLPLAGRPLVAHVVLTLQQVPEISEVWVVGNLDRLEPIFADSDLRAALRKPLFLAAQRRSLIENCWETYRCILSRDPKRGQDPGEDDLDQEVLYLSGDLPFATAQEISAFLAQAHSLDCDYAVGMVTEEALQGFLPTAPGAMGIEVAYFNLRDGRLRQSNLHWARPARIAQRERIEEMYEHRHQREFWNMAMLAWRLFWAESAGPVIVALYTMMHLAGIADRWGLRSLADRLRGWVTLELNERVIGRLLGTRFRFVVTEVGGCAIDVDTDYEYDAVRANFEDWRRAQSERAEKLHGPPRLPAEAGESKS